MMDTYPGKTWRLIITLFLNIITFHRISPLIILYIFCLFKSFGLLINYVINFQSFWCKVNVSFFLNLIHSFTYNKTLNVNVLYKYKGNDLISHFIATYLPIEYYAQNAQNMNCFVQTWTYHYFGHTLNQIDH